MQIIYLIVLYEGAGADPVPWAKGRKILDRWPVNQKAYTHRQTMGNSYLELHLICMSLDYGGRVPGNINKLGKK